MRTLPSIVCVVCAACMLAGPVGAAPNLGNGAATVHAPDAAAIADYHRNVTCAAATAALSARLPPTSSDKKRQDAQEMVVRERNFAVEAGNRIDVSEPEIDRLIAQKRDEITTHAAKAGSDGKINRDLFIRAIECELDQLGAAIKKAKAAKAAGETAR